jgi:integrase
MPPQPTREEIHPLTPEQAKLLLQVAHESGDRLEALYVLAIHTGLRQGELLGLKWDDVDLEDGSLQVRRTLTITKDGPVFGDAKTAGSRRGVRNNPHTPHKVWRDSQRSHGLSIYLDTLAWDQTHV